MNDYFLYVTVIAAAIFAYMFYAERKKNFTLQVELDLIKSRGRLGSVNANLEDNRAAYKAARDKFNAELHPYEPIPDYMLEYVTRPSTTPPGFERSKDSDFDSGSQPEFNLTEGNVGGANGIRKPHR